MTLPSVFHFDDVYNNWKSGITHVIVNSLAIRVSGSWLLFSGQVFLSPKERPVASSEIVETEQLRVATEVLELGDSALDSFLSNIRKGALLVSDQILCFPPDEKLSEYSPMHSVEPVYFSPQLEVRTERPVGVPQSFSYFKTNAELRAATVPFDGLVDVLSYFGFGTDGRLPNDCMISVALHPPCDLLIDKCSLEGNVLTATVCCRAEYSQSQIALGVRQFPNPTAARRHQIAAKIAWQRDSSGIDIGTVSVTLDDCTAVSLMLTAGGFSVRRLYVSDPRKSLNHRLTNYRVFDPNISHLLKFLNADRSDSRKLEIGVATLGYLLGGTSVNPPSQETPDVLLETPEHRLILIECTIRVEDLRAKVGKLVHRREEVVFNHRKCGITQEVLALLVVNQSRDKIVNEAAYLLAHRIILITLEDIDLALSYIEKPPALDELCVRKMAELELLSVAASPLTINH